MTTLRRRIASVAIGLGVVVSGLGACSSSPKADVAKICHVGVTRAQLELTAGQVVPGAMTRTRTGLRAARSYLDVCRAFVTAPGDPNGQGAVVCPEDSNDPGTVVVEFFAGRRTVDRLDIVPTGCETMHSTRLGTMRETNVDAFRSVSASVEHGFGVSDTDIYGR
jgi:hypothetical protein